METKKEKPVEEPRAVDPCGGIVLPRMVPLGVLILLVVQIALASLYAGRLDARVTQLESQVTAYGEVSVRLAKMEERVDQNMLRITSRLDGLKETMGGVRDDMKRMHEEKTNARR